MREPNTGEKRKDYVNLDLLTAFTRTSLKSVGRSMNSERREP